MSSSNPENTKMHLVDYFRRLPVPAKLKEDIYFNDNIKLNQNLIDNISKINVVIGPNNSGKSLFCRELLKTQIESEYFSDYKIHDLNIKLKEFKKRYTAIFKGLNTDYFQNNDGIIRLSMLNKAFTEITKTTNIRQLHREIEPLLNRLSTSYFWGLSNALPKHDIDEPLSDKKSLDINKKFEPIVKEFKEVFNRCFNQSPLTRIYTPTIRTLRTYQGGLDIRENVNDDYSLLENNSEATNLTLVNKETIINTGQNFYKEIRTLNNSDFAGQQKLRSFQDFLSVNFFDGQSVHIIPDEHKPLINIKIGIEREQLIHNLGEGIQSIIILTFPLFMFENAILVIEEPELFIHPGLQRKLLEIYSSNEICPNFIFFLVTHSNHIMEAALSCPDSTLFSIEKLIPKNTNSHSVLPKFNLRTLSFGDDRILTSLGITNNSVFQSNSLIWVEGITDKLYLQKLISTYLQNPKKKILEKARDFVEGKHYMFVFSAGDNIIHYDFNEEVSIKELSKKSAVRFICSKSLVIVDSDLNKNRERKNKLKSELKLNFLELPVVEIENLLSPKVVIKTVQSFPSWSTSQESDFPPFSESDYEQKRLGSFIDTHFQGVKTKGRKKKFAISSKPESSINCKIEFCENALNHITPTSMSVSSQKVVEKILQFIIKANHQV
tara:strand:- start:133 stop:2121 length:1989 start_codon:yes stop_codon:yes gene_type:complete